MDLEHCPERVWGDMRKGDGWPLTQSEAVKRVWDQEGRPYVEYVRADRCPEAADPSEVKRLREALNAYRSAVRCGESESEQLRALGDEALRSIHEAPERMP